MDAPDVNSKTFSRVTGLHSPSATQESADKCNASVFNFLYVV